MECLKLSDFNTYYKAIEIKTMGNWHKHRHRDEWNGIETLEINPHMYDHVISNKGARTIQWEKV